jgi:CHASE2 domain-containing sensor protein
MHDDHPDNPFKMSLGHPGPPGPKPLFSRDPATLKFGIVRILCLASVVLFYIFMLSTPVLERFENIFLDAFFRARGEITAHPDIVFIEIDEKSFASMGRWPWPRKNHAVLTRVLKEWGAKKIIFDFVFPAPSQDPGHDPLLAQAFHEAGNIFLPVYFEKRPPVWIHSLPIFEKEARAVGHVNITPDSDGVLRRIKPRIRFGDEIYWNLAFQVVYEKDKTRVSNIPLDENGSMLINWAGKWTKAFSHISYVDLLLGYKAMSEGKKTRSVRKRSAGKSA